ncbi:MAG: PQQ-binding-like beta-propeller repeat protein [Bacteroidales bacterium]|nr:PQQ-binding-like beta-propeller repeat protein [Bacteroidales bacterium]
MKKKLFFTACLRKRHLLAFSFMVQVMAVMAQGVAQWRGPDRSGNFPENGLLKEWPAEGPVLLWSVSGIGEGYSSPVCDGKAVYVTGMKNDSDYLTAISDKGNIIRQVSYGSTLSETHPGSRCTPAVDADNIYVLSEGGAISCIGVKDGMIKWSLDAQKEFKPSYSAHGICESLLVSEDNVFYTPCGPKTTLVALDKNTGETRWATESLNDVSAYVSPLLIKYADKQIIVTLTSEHLLGIDAENGKFLWFIDHSKLFIGTRWYAASNAITPLFSDSCIYITGGYNQGGAKFSLNKDASAIDLVWTDSVLDCHIGGVVLVDGYIYGSNWINNRKGDWCCLDWKTGKSMYVHTWFTKGSIIAAGGMLYCLEEKTGNLGLVRPDPNKFDLVSSLKIPLGKGPFWAHPTIRNGILYIRHGDVLMAYDLRRMIN